MPRMLFLAAGLAGSALAERMTVSNSVMEEMTASAATVRLHDFVEGHGHLGRRSVFAVEPEQDGKCKDVIDKIKRLAERELKKGGEESDAATFLGDVDELSGETLLHRAQAVLDHVNLQDSLEQGEVITLDDTDTLLACTTGDQSLNEERTVTEDGKVIVQGDMIYENREDAEAALLEIAGGSRWPGKPWPNGEVKYCFPPNATERLRTVWDASVKHIMEQIPCVSFTDVGFDKEDRCKVKPAIFIKSERGCSSNVGVMPWKYINQNIQLAPGCQSLGTAVHEILHAMGFSHEQSREDRDKYVKIKWDNIKEGAERNFNIDANTTTETPYDVLSIMHYSYNEFAKDRTKGTLEGKNGRMTVYMGQRDGLSELDVELLGKMYGCQGTPKVKSNYRNDVLQQPQIPQRPTDLAGKIRIWAKRAHKVPRKADGEKPKPFLSIHHGALAMQTWRTKNETKSPKWNDVFVFPYDESKPLDLKIVHHGFDHLPELLGETSLTVDGVKGCSEGCSLQMGEKEEFKLDLCISLCTAQGCGCKRG